MAAALEACIDSLITTSPKGPKDGDTIADAAHAATDGTTHNDSDLRDDDDNLPKSHKWLTSDLTGGTVIAASVSASDELTDSSPVGTAADPVPDSGATAALLGFALGAIRLLKPRFG
jgi:hypothetical protein